jgi:hypothetical protein
MRLFIPLLCIVLAGCGGDGDSGSKPQTTQHTLLVTKLGVGSGRVTSSPAGIDCGSDCSAAFANGDSVSLTAAAAENSNFVGWGGDASGTDDAVTIVMTEDKTVSAAFDEVPPAQVGLVNGDFEQGPGVGWTQEPSALILLASSFGISAYSGQYVAIFGPSDDNRHSASMEQVLTLPGTTPLYLKLAVWIYSEEICDIPWYDDFGFYVNGVAVERNDRLCNTHNTDGWTRGSISISQYAGQRVTFRFEIFSNAGDPLASWVGIDALEISTTP